MNQRAKFLSEKQAQGVAREAGLSPDAVFRLCGSIQVAVPPLKRAASKDSDLETMERAAARVMQFGLRLDDYVRGEMASVSTLIAVLPEVIREYRNCCPIVFRWLSSGGFRPERIPDDVDRGKLIHANRTAGRLRATCVRRSR